MHGGRHEKVNYVELKLRDEIRMKKCLRRIVGLEASWRFLENRNVEIFPPVEAFGIHIPGEHHFLISWAENAAGTGVSSTLER